MNRTGFCFTLNSCSTFLLIQKRTYEWKYLMIWSIHNSFSSCFIFIDLLSLKDNSQRIVFIFNIFRFFEFRSFREIFFLLFFVLSSLLWVYSGPVIYDQRSCMRRINELMMNYNLSTKIIYRSRQFGNDFCFFFFISLFPHFFVSCETLSSTSLPIGRLVSTETFWKKTWKKKKKKKKNKKKK